jgi:alpha-glucosidase
MKYKINTFHILAFLGIILSSCTNVDEILTISSPNNINQLTFSLTESGEPQYELTSSKKPIITTSKMGFEFVENQKMIDGFKIINYEIDSVNTTWEQPWGEFKTIKDQHTKLTVHLQETLGEKRLVDIIFKVFNDGLGFRYYFPEQPNLKEVKISNELTEFTFPEEHNVWWIPVHSDNSYYESLYRKSPISKTDTINTPATFETKDGIYLAIHEANLTDFASMTLRYSGKNKFQSELVPWADGVKVYAKTPFETPWRTIIIAENPGELVTSTLMLNLNESSKIEDFSWIEPSKYIGIWWGMHLEKYTWGSGEKHGATTKNTKEYIDFAAENGFNGVLVEGWNVGWDGDWTADGTSFSFTQPYPDFDIEEISSYAAKKGVRLIGHHETAGAASHYENQLEAAFELYNKKGVNAVKTGYVNKYLDKKEWHDSQFGVRHYRKVIETAAKYHIMIDNHEPVKGTGLQRTYPNLMTQEGARGQEYNAWSNDGGNPPEHTTILPFTRMLSGPMDFTPGNFGFDYKSVQGAKVQTTLAKQLALYVVLFSPLQMASDLPENYVGQPAFKFIKDVPSIWSETKVLDSKIGEYVVIARKDWEEKNWYLGAITNSEGRNLEISFSFLDPTKKYTAEIYTDGKEANYKSNPYPVAILKQSIDSDSKLTLRLAPGGGTAIKVSLVE